MAVTTNKLETFLSKLELLLIQNAQDMLPSMKNIPSWAISCADLFYTDKSIPQEFNEPGELYISFKIDQPKVVQLRGKTKDHKPINRNLIVEQKASSVTIHSQHFNISSDNMDDLLTGQSYITYTGSGKTFKMALDQYFSNSKLKKSDFNYNAGLNIQSGGDAFLFQQKLAIKGYEVIAKEIVGAVREIFHLIPEDKHRETVKQIEKTLRHFNDLIRAGEIKKIAHHYDPRLWLIVDSICKQFDPLQKAEDRLRQDKRDRLIAECCSKHMRDENIIPCLEAYFNVMKMHRDLLDALESGGIVGDSKKTLEEYRVQNLVPEVKGHHEQIKEFHHKFRTSK